MDSNSKYSSAVSLGIKSFKDLKLNVLTSKYFKRTTKALMSLAMVSTVFAEFSIAQQVPPVSTVLDQSPIKTDEKFLIELFNYEEVAYSQSKKTEIGDQLKLTSRFRYQFNENGWVSAGFSTRPEQNRFNNKTSQFEVRSGYTYNQFTAQIDLELNTNDDQGGITFGPDLDSENTFLLYNFNKRLQMIFFPFNFNGEVGVEFNTNDVTRVYFVDGAPSVINPIPNGNERLASKTIPGFELRYNKFNENREGHSFYVGLGSASYLYPNDPGFDITQATGATSWARREDIGYKMGALLKNSDTFTSLQFVGHTADAETGSLLKSAGSFYSLNQMGRIIFEAEVTASQGGERPYRLNRSFNWFETESYFGSDIRQRVYSDNTGNPHDWLGKWGYAGSLKVGMAQNGYTPYLSYKFQDENFVYRDRESAHILRTNDDSQSHGGLHRLGIGAYIYKDNFIINPRFEYLIASNDVFSDRNDITQERIVSGFKNQDFYVFINVAYFYDKRTGPRTFRL